MNYLKVLTVATAMMALSGCVVAIGDHDENDNKKLDKNFVGVPLEGYGVSNNIRHMMSAPEFKESSFQVNGEVDKNIKIRMGY